MPGGEDLPTFTAAGLVRRFGRVVALGGVDVSASGKAIGLLGPNGAGKSTLLKILIGLLPPSSGRATILGLNARHERVAIRQRIGFVPEDEGDFPGMEGVKAIAYAAKLSGLGHADSLKRAHEVLDFVGLGEERYRVSSTYSTGMKQLLKISQALVHDPELLVLDEPTNGVDPRHRDEVLSLIGELVDSGMKVIISSHLLADVQELCDGVVILDRGRVVESGLIDELRARGRPRVVVEPTARLDELAQALRARGLEPEDATTRGRLVLHPSGSAADAAEEIAAVAAATGIGLRHLELERDSLEDVFLRALSEGGESWP